ncbi:MAG: glutamine-hydrolyzing GMP synthase [Rickettsiales bacterium]|nr:glutamine-hydrolyzing GMP synthase [Rickettsiales bacterium]
MKTQIIIIDFGSQVTKLIARRIREIDVFCEVIPFNNIEKEFKSKIINSKGIIFSGGPSSVYSKDAPLLGEKIFKLGIPILGICYGFQLICDFFKGKVKKSKKREFGKANINILKKSVIIDGIYEPKKKYRVWMSHSDIITNIPRDFETIALSENSILAIIENKKKKIFGLQFHPEVNHTDKGDKIISNFVLKISKAKKDWNMRSFKIDMVKKIKEVVGQKNVICGLSGGVDSTVTAVLINEAIGKQLHCIFVDTGLMRKNEPEEIESLFKRNFAISFKRINASNLFLKKLRNISNPEKKRKIIGNLFIELFERYSKKLRNVVFLAQGTLYPDVIESVASSGKKKVTIKSHHNVGGLPKKMNLNLLEPLRELFKDEVRILGKELGIPKEFISRHPFPGPGLGIRILGDITRKKIKILKEADSIFIDALKKANLYDKIWQAFCVLLPVKTVGVMGDNRTYEQICVLRAVTSKDGMTAESFSFEHRFISECANKIVNNVKGINRVCYDCTSKPPGTIEYE